MGNLDTDSHESQRITLGLLEALNAGRVSTQRGLAADLGIALGLVNIYLKRCVKKGLVKVAHAPARRYAYYLTPSGFAEKSRLAAEFLSLSLTYFRQAKASCATVFEEARRRGWQRIALAGGGDLADIARICAADRGIEIVAIISPEGPWSPAASPPVLAGFDEISGPLDGIVLTDIAGSHALRRAAEHAVGRQRVLCPSIVPEPPPESAVTFSTLQADEVAG